MAKKIAIASDHAGFLLKEELVSHFSKNFQFRDFGPLNDSPVDYPDYASLVAKEVQSGNSDHGILLCGSGIGMSIVANKYHGVRSAVVADEEAAILSKQHNDTNILCLPARKISLQLAIQLVETWMKTGFESGRHGRRIKKILQIEVSQVGVTKL